MAHTFEVIPFGLPEERYTIVPMNVTFVRPVYDAVEIHDAQCNGAEDDKCPITELMEMAPGSVLDPDTYWGCRVTKGKEYAEILFTNTIGPQSSIKVDMPRLKVQQLLNSALAGL